MPFCGIEDAKWKREIIQDHSFDYLDVQEFYDPSWFGHLSYAKPFLVVLRSVLMYTSDIWTGYNLAFNYDIAKKLYFGRDSNELYRIIFLVSIGMSCLLLLYEMRKASRILRTRDISFTFTNTISHRVYVLGSYYNYCFFQRISASHKFVDDVAFYVFFTLKGWKRVLFAVAPREAIKTIVLFKLFQKSGTQLIKSAKVSDYIAVGTLAATNLLFVISLFQTILASLLYIPLLFYIQGNLKEYCCFKIDKRISELLAKQRCKRQLQNQFVDERGTLLKNISSSKGDISSLPKPTLPQIQLDDQDELSMYSQGSSTHTSHFVSQGAASGSHSISPSLRIPSRISPSGRKNSSLSSHSYGFTSGRSSEACSTFLPPPNLRLPP